MGMSIEEAEALNVGDKVTISSLESIREFSLDNGLPGENTNGTIHTPARFVPEMRSLCGKTFLIAKVEPERGEGDEPFFYLRSVDGVGQGLGWAFDRFMLEGSFEATKALDETVKIMMDELFESMLKPDQKQ